MPIRKRIAQRNSLSLFYYPSSWVSLELSYQAHRLFPGDQAAWEPLNKIPRNASNLVDCYYHICATMSHSCLITLWNPVSDAMGVLAAQSWTVRVGGGSENMERGAEFSCEERWILRDAHGSSSLSRAGGPGGVSSVRIGPRKALDMLAKGINTKYGTTSGDILSLHLKTCSQFNTRLSDQNRKSSRGAGANGHAGDTRTSALGPSVVIGPSSKRKIPVTRDDRDESMLWSGPAVLDSEAVSTGWSHSSMASCPQTVPISYCDSRIVVANV